MPKTVTQTGTTNYTAIYLPSRSKPNQLKWIDDSFKLGTPKNTSAVSVKPFQFSPPQVGMAYE
jgi:hypothetical protein